MTRLLIGAIALLVLAPPPLAAEPASPEAILKRALAARPCPQFETAQGWIVHRTSPLSDLTGAVSDQITAVDRSRRRYVSRIRQTKPDDETDFSVTRYAYADGQFYACAAHQAETCKLEPLAADNVTPEDITSAWIQLGDLRAADRGGATIAAAPVPPEIEGAVEAVTLTPQGGRPYVLYIAEDGAIVAADIQGPQSTVRTWLDDYRDLDGCASATAMRIEILPAMPGKYLVWKLETFEYRDAMAPEDTQFE